MCNEEVRFAKVWESSFQKRLDRVSPREIDKLLMRLERIRTGSVRNCEAERDGNYPAPGARPHSEEQLTMLGSSNAMNTSCPVTSEKEPLTN